MKNNWKQVFKCLTVYIVLVLILNGSVCCLKMQGKEVTTEELSSNKSVAVKEAITKESLSSISTSVNSISAQAVESSKKISNSNASLLKNKSRVLSKTETEAQAAFELAKKKYEIDRLNAFAELII